MKVDLLPQLPSVLTKPVEVAELEVVDAVLAEKTMVDVVEEAELVVPESSPHVPNALLQPVPQ